MKPRLRLYLLLSTLFLLWSCVPSTPPDPPLTSGHAAAEDLMSRLRLSPAMRVQGLDELIVKPGSPQCITLKCTDTPMHLLLPLLAEKTGIAFRVGRIEPVFRVSAQLHDVPVEECLSVLFSGSDYLLRPKVEADKTIWVLQDRPQLDSSLDKSSATVLLSLQHTPSASLAKNLLGIGQNAGLIQNDSSVAGAAIDAHSISLRGMSQKLRGLSRVLRQADQPAPTILVRTRKFATIEELILTYFGNPQSGYTFMGGPLTSLSLPNSTNSNIAIGSNQQNLGAGAAYARIVGPSDRPGSMQAILSGLVQRIKEDYFADTQVTVLSGQSASIVAGRQGYVCTPTYADGLVVNNPLQINASTSLTVTPTALPNGEIRLQVNYSTYRLIPNEFNLVGTIRGAGQTAFLQIPAGQPVIVSGSSFAQLTSQWDGWNRLQHLPIVGPLLRASTEDQLLEDGLLVIWAEIVAPTDPRAQLTRDITTAPACPVADDSHGTTVDQMPRIL